MEFIDKNHREDVTLTTNPAADPITLEVVRNKLDGIANEMQSTLVRSAFSPIVKEGLDASASLFTLEGETLAQATAIPIHLATLIPVVRTMIEKVPGRDHARGRHLHHERPLQRGDPPAGHRAGDADLLPRAAHRVQRGDDPPPGCGRHVAGLGTDQRDRDLPGRDPNPAAQVPGRNEVNQTLVDLLTLNVRVPETFMGDLNAQVAACSIGARRMGELAERYGSNHLPAIAEALLSRSERLARRAIERIPDGHYHYVDWLDNDGVALDEPVRIEVAVEIAADRVLVDFEGTSPQVRGPFNCVPSGAYAGAYFAVLAMTDSAIPINGGCFRPIELRLPEGSLVNPREPAPVNARTSTIKRIAGSIIGALRQARPEEAPADAAAALHVLAFGGAREDGSPYVVGELIASGSGASRGRDGVDVIETDGSNCMNLPVEALEMDVPIRMHRSELRPDSGGTGEFRGGLGISREYEVLAGEVVFTHRESGTGARPRGRPVVDQGRAPTRSFGVQAVRRRSFLRRPWSGSTRETGWRSIPRAAEATATPAPELPIGLRPTSSGGKVSEEAWIQSTSAAVGDD